MQQTKLDKYRVFSTHYYHWLDAYYPFLDTMFTITVSNSHQLKTDDYTFENFCIMIYRKSNKYITEYT